MGKAIGGKADEDRIQKLTGTMSSVIDQIRQFNGQLTEISKRADLMSAKRIMTAVSELRA